jgi:undecaprenyl-diphosphatase
MGLAQTCALVPGVSRSGSTIGMALALGLARPEAARFSFLLGIPAIAGAGILELKPAVAALRGAPVTPIVLATIIAAISSYASIAWLIRWLGTHHLTPFAVYRILIGIAIAALAAAGIAA